MKAIRKVSRNNESGKLPLKRDLLDVGFNMITPLFCMDESIVKTNRLQVTFKENFRMTVKHIQTHDI